MPTAREEITQTLKAQGWKVAYADKPNLIATWRRRKIAVRFTDADAVQAVVLHFPVPRNAGTEQLMPSQNKRETTLAFIRGEPNSR